MAIEIWFDGAGTVGRRGGCGAIIRRDGRIIHEISDSIGQGPDITCNVAEYVALRKALIYLIDAGLTDEKTYVYGDSQLVIQQMSGKWKIKAGVYVSQALACKKEINKFSDIRLRWIPREQNTEADLLSFEGAQKHEYNSRITGIRGKTTGICVYELKHRFIDINKIIMI